MSRERGLVAVSRRGGVTCVKLRRPDRRNALTEPMLAEMTAAIGDAGDDSGAVLLAGEGSCFSAGFDLELCVEHPEGEVMRGLLRGLAALVEGIRACPCPVVVAAHGAAIAGACAIVAGADLAVADRGAKLGYPVVLLGISPAVSAPSLGAKVGQGPSRGLMLDPGLISGERAWALGLVNEVVQSRESVLPAASRLAAELASKPRGAVRETKAWLAALDRASEGARAALESSLGLAGGEEEQELLGAFWASKGS